MGGVSASVSPTTILNDRLAEPLEFFAKHHHVTAALFRGSARDDARPAV
jgi:hypothetical protein